MIWLLSCVPVTGFLPVDISPDHPTTAQSLTAFVPERYGAVDFTWHLDGVADVNGPTVAADRTRKHQVWTAVARGGAHQGEASVTIVNSAPEAEVVIQPDDPRKGMALHAAATVVDADNDVVDVSWVWLRDGENTDYSGPVLPAETARAGEVWEARARVTDGEATSIASASVEVANSPPTVELVQIAPTEPRVADVIEVVWSAVDEDDDVITTAILWSVNGTARGTDTTVSGGLVKGDLVAVEVTPFDGLDWGPPARDEVIVRNTPPQLSGLKIVPEHVRSLDEVGFWADTDDADADDLTLTARWFADGALIFEGSLLESPHVEKGSVLGVEVVAFDGEDPSVALQDETVVLNSPPTVPRPQLPSSVRPFSQDLVCALETPSSDADGDPLHYSFVWHHEGVEFEDVVGTHHPGDTVAKAALDHGTWTCEVAVSDGEVEVAAQDVVSTRSALDGNVLVLVADDLGTNMLELYGEFPDRPPTPNLDALAAAGVTFERAYSNPSCSPTRAAALTGRYTQRYGIGWAIAIRTDDRDVALPYEEWLIPEWLMHATPEYQTAQIGKWHLAGVDVSEHHALEQGFDIRVGTVGNLTGDYFSFEKFVGEEAVQEDRYATTVTVDDALDVLPQLGEPWFVWVGFHAPHKPFHAPPSDLHTQPTPTTRKQEYRAMVEALDTEIGRLLAGIEPRVLSETTVVFVGDNGTPRVALDVTLVPHHAKGSLYEGGVHVPMVVSGPHVTSPGTRTDALVHVVDLLPTVLEIAGLLPGEAPGSPPLDGVSFLSVLEDPAHGGQRTHVWIERFKDPGPPPWTVKDERALIGDRYKLIWDLIDDRFEFYDLARGLYDGPDLLRGTLTISEQEEFDALRSRAEALDASLGYEY